MSKRISSQLILAIAVAVVVLVGAPAHATPIVEFTFDGVQPGPKTEILVRPEITPFPSASFFAVFRDFDGFLITLPVLGENFTGQTLFTFGDALLVQFNRPIDQVTVDFAMGIFNTEPPGFLRLRFLPNGTFDQASSDLGGLFQGGTLTFTWDKPYINAFLLQAFRSNGDPVMFEIDNLRVDVVTPEPSTVTLLAAGLLVLARRRFGGRVRKE